MLTWREQSAGFIRTDGGRFDILRAAHTLGWVVYDWDRGKRHEAGSLDEALAWCEAREAGEAAKLKGAA